MKLFYRFGLFVFRSINRVYFNWRVLNRDRVPPTGKVILASNHASYYDPFIVGAGVRREVYYLARSSAFWFPLGFFLRNVNAVPVDRDGGGPGGLMKVLDVLNKDCGVVLFPEGTRTYDGKLQTPRSGIGLITIKSGAPVVPVRVFGSYEAWNRHMKIPRPRQITVKYGHPIDFSGLRNESLNCSKERLKAIYQEVANRIMAEIAALRPEAD